MVARHRAVAEGTSRRLPYTKNQRLIGSSIQARRMRFPGPRSMRRECPAAIERFDEIDAAMHTLCGALECVDLHTGQLHRPAHVEELLAQVAGRIESLRMGECTTLAKYLRNRAPGLVPAQKSVLPRLEALADAGGELGGSVRVLGQGAEDPSTPCPGRGAVTSSARRLRGTARPARRCQCSGARCGAGGAAPAPSRCQCHGGIRRDAASLSLRPQGRPPGLPRAVPSLVQSAHAALGTAQGDPRSPVPDRSAGPRLAHAARVPALTRADRIDGRYRALTAQDTPNPSTACLGTGPLACVKMNRGISIGAPGRTNERRRGIRSRPRGHEALGGSASTGPTVLPLPTHP